MPTNEEIRIELRKYARLFLEKNCGYNANEQICCQELLHRVSAVNPTYEAYNAENPDHGNKKTS